jgi:hypothetical protein
MRIFRSILLNENEEIDRKNLGVSWSLCENFVVDHAEDINRVIEKDDFEIIETEISENQIDWDNTLFAMENRPNEFEVVLLPNINVDCGNIGSGRDFADYCCAYDGELTKDDFFKLANEF